MFITMCLTENNVSQESILLAHPNYELRNVQSLLITLSILIVPICELLLAVLKKIFLLYISEMYNLILWIFYNDMAITFDVMLLMANYPSCLSVQHAQKYVLLYISRRSRSYPETLKQLQRL